MNNFIVRYFKRTEKYSTGRYIIEITVVAFLLKIISSIFFDLLLSLFNYHPVTDLSYETSQVKQGLIVVSISVPFFASIETLIGQMFIIWITSKLTKKVWIIILTSTIIFTALHIDPAQMIAVLPVGGILAYTFWRFKSQSNWKAFWVTTTIHSLHNYIALLLVWLSLH
jgi:hypothetical protein